MSTLHSRKARRKLNTYYAGEILNLNFSFLSIGPNFFSRAICCWDRIRHRNKPLVPWWVSSPSGFLGVCLNLAITHYRCTANLNHGPTSRSELSSLPTTHSGVAVLLRVCPVDVYQEVLGFLTNAFPSSRQQPFWINQSQWYG